MLPSSVHWSTGIRQTLQPIRQCRSLEWWSPPHVGPLSSLHLAHLELHSHPFNWPTNSDKAKRVLEGEIGSRSIVGLQNQLGTQVFHTADMQRWNFRNGDCSQKFLFTIMFYGFMLIWLSQWTLKKKFELYFPTKYVNPKSLKLSHWPSKIS